MNRGVPEDKEVTARIEREKKSAREKVSLKILGYDYALSQEPVIGLENRGFFNAEVQTIRIAQEMSQQSKEATVLHEIIHALDFALAIDLSETQVRQLEHGLYQVLTANGVSLSPLLIEYSK